MAIVTRVGKGSPLTRAEMDNNLTAIDNLITLSGVAEDAADLGAFTGTTIQATPTVKVALQDLETAVELKSDIASPTFTGTVTAPALILSSETASTLASFDGSKNVKSLATASYPSLTEIAYVKGVTSAIQTQMNTKAPSASPAFTVSVTIPSYADLAGIQAVITVPAENMMVRVVGQGLAVYDGSDWVLASDDSTPIT